MCFHHMGLPFGADVIANLEPGDEILVKPGFSSNPSDEERTLVVAYVSGFSALCCDGTRLGCNDGVGVTPTGKHFDTVVLSVEAKRILSEATITHLYEGQVITVADHTGWPASGQERQMVVVRVNEDAITALAVAPKALTAASLSELVVDSFVYLTRMDGLRVVTTDDYLDPDPSPALQEFLDDFDIRLTL